MIQVSTISVGYGIPLILSTSCSMGGICNGSRVSSMSFALSGLRYADDIWTSSIFSKTVPYHTRSSGAYGGSVAANFSSDSTDIALQRPAL